MLELDGSYLDGFYCKRSSGKIDEEKKSVPLFARAAVAIFARNEQRAAASVESDVDRL